MSPSESLTAWHKFWILKGPCITCRKCGQQQSEANSRNSFVHAEPCLPCLSGLSPWETLGFIIRHKYRV